MNQEIDTLVELSRELGEGVDWVVGGGGNTSIKDDDTLYVKASGTTLRGISGDQFVAMDRSRLDAIWNRSYPADSEEREAQALADLLAARRNGDSAPRPSVETLMHALFPNRLVVHTHPTLVNGLTCSRDGRQACTELFGDDALWIATVNPGYTLAKFIASEVDAWRSRHDGAWPQILVMQNHGLTVAGESPDEVRALHAKVVSAVRSRIGRQPGTGDAEAVAAGGGAELGQLAQEIAAAVADLEPTTAGQFQYQPFVNDELLRRASSGEAFAAIASALTPDHIVYSGHRPCYVASSQPVKDALSDYRSAYGALPKIVVKSGIGAIAIGASERKTELARLLFLDSLKIACYAESFGGTAFMPQDQIDFIRNWEVEKFRERQSTGDNG